MKQTEDQLQAQAVTWFRTQYKRYYWNLIAVPNGGKRNLLTAVKMKRTGTLSGAWDLFLSVPRGSFSGLYIEMKVGKNKLTKNQLEFFKANSQNYYMRVCGSLDQFINVINEYLK